MRLIGDCVAVMLAGKLAGRPLSAHRVTGPDPGTATNEACCRLAAGVRSSAGKRVAVMAN
jgi:hypothetical protein